MTPNKLGRYEVLRVIGKGAMGVVYEGRDPNLDRRIALKTVKVENLSEEAAAEYELRFRTEARSAARLQHPNIVSVYDSDRDGGVAFLVMEYIQGDDLKHHLDRGVRYSLEQSLKIVRDLLSALDYAHKQGIVHRDIKPANLLIEPAGRVKLTDFGVARIQDAAEATRTQGSMVGTLKYMAPEQVQGQKIDARADLFSAGVVLYQLLTDKRPFDGENDFSIIHQIIGSHPPPPSSINPRLPTALDAVVARALAKDRDERFATARDFAVALQSAIRRAEDQTVVPPPNPNRKPEPAQSRPLTRPGTVPGGVTSPSIGSQSSVTQELELVYWKDVKDSADPEEIQGFLERFPAGIYADLARRRLRKLAGGEQTVAAPVPQPGPAAPAFGASVFASSMFPEEPSPLPTEPSRPAPELRPAQWIDEEYTRTVAEAPAAAPAPTPPAPAVKPPVATPVAASAAEPVARADAGEPPVSRPEPAREPAPSARRKAPLAVLAGIGVLAVAGALALVVGRGKPFESGAPQAGSPAVATVAAPPAPSSGSVVATAPTDAVSPPPAAAAAPAPEAPRPKAEKAPPAPRPAAKASRVPAPAPSSVAAAPEAPHPAVAAAASRAESQPPAPRAPAVDVAQATNFRAVEQCRDRLFLARELCLADHCDKPGARSHPLCVLHREEARIREESKQLQR